MPLQFSFLHFFFDGGFPHFRNRFLWLAHLPVFLILHPGPPLHPQPLQPTEFTRFESELIVTCLSDWTVPICIITAKIRIENVFMTSPPSFCQKYYSRVTGITMLVICLVNVLASNARAEPDCGLYKYKAVVVRVVDGDTVRADIDLGFNTWRRNEPLRLYGIDAPEPKGETSDAGKAATAALASRIEGKELVICTIKDRTGKFGQAVSGRSRHQPMDD